MNTLSPSSTSSQAASVAWLFLSKGFDMDTYTAVMLAVIFAASVVSAFAAVYDNGRLGALALVLAAVWVLMMGGW